MDRHLVRLGDEVEGKAALSQRGDPFGANFGLGVLSEA